MKDLNQIAVFAKVANARNFTEASHALGITSSAVSKIVTRLEAELGTRLFNRSTRAVQLTPEGAGFLESCRELLAQVDMAEERLHETHQSLRGTVHLTMPMGYGRRVVAPALPSFADRYPDIVIEAELSDRTVDLSYETTDVCIVRGTLPDVRVLARPLCELAFVPCASPAYLERHGWPREPEDLMRHQCMAYLGPQMSRHREWVFQRHGKSFAMQLSGRVNMNSAETLLEAAIAGMGIVMLSTMYTADPLKAGQLVPLLVSYMAPSTPVSAVYLPSKARSRRAMALVEFLSRLSPPSVTPEFLASAGGTA